MSTVIVVIVVSMIQLRKRKRPLVEKGLRCLSRFRTVGKSHHFFPSVDLQCHCFLVS